MDRNKDYIILQAIPDEIEDMVNHKLAKGYIPVGGPFLSDLRNKFGKRRKYVCQAMMRHLDILSEN